jgi:hypothetical protein
VEVVSSQYARTRGAVVGDGEVVEKGLKMGTGRDRECRSAAETSLEWLDLFAVPQANGIAGITDRSRPKSAANFS